ncbi:MAG: MaoC family dehydratase [Burkholderiales bacterium]|nr:MaoC family dehydratase [Burkholderiales bacterium]
MATNSSVGFTHQFKRIFTQGDFNRFAALSGDDNPIHCDPVFAKTSHFGATVAHGMMLYSTICKGLSEAFGPSVVQLEQELMFPNPTYVGDEVTVTLEVKDIHPDHSLDVATIITKPGQADQPLVTCQGASRVCPNGVRAGIGPWRAAVEEASDAELYGLTVGMRASSTRTFTEADLEEYADLTGDKNPLFRSADIARAQGFDRCLIPGPLLSGMFSDLLGTKLPGRGTGWMKQKNRFPQLAYLGQTLTATVEIVRLRADKELVNLKSTVTTADGTLVCDGETLVLVRNLENKGPKV